MYQRINIIFIDWCECNFWDHILKQWKVLRSLQNSTVIIRKNVVFVVFLIYIDLLIDYTQCHYINTIKCDKCGVLLWYSLMSYQYNFVLNSFGFRRLCVTIYYWVKTINEN